MFNKRICTIGLILTFWLTMVMPELGLCIEEGVTEKQEEKIKETDEETVDEDADEEDIEKSDEEEELTEEEKAEEERKKKRLDSEGRPILSEGETGILVERKTGIIVYESDSQKRMYPASTTKIMTALIAIEAIDRGEIALEDKVEVTEEMLKGLDPDGSNMALVAGEILSMKDLLRGLMIPSGNDAAMAIAYKIGGDVEVFVEKMNNRASELGMKDTHFMNPHGLHHEEHYTTAADMAKLSCVAMGNYIFRDIVDIAHVKIAPTNKTEKGRYYINTNGLLSTMRYADYYYKGAIGVKTGRTTDAGNCLVSAVNRDGLEFVGVLFGGKEIEDSHKDTIRMMDYGYENYEIRCPVSEGDVLGEVKVKHGRKKDTVTVSAKENVYVVVKKDTDPNLLEVSLNLPEAVYAPITKGQEVSNVTISLNGAELGRGELLADVDVSRTVFWPVLAIGEWLWSFMIVRILVCAAGVVIVWFIIALIFNIRKNAKRRSRRKNK